jgi:RNase adaptor protein for sRNA GlmZ degradation
MLIVVSRCPARAAALRTLEDRNYYCVDNLPAELLTSLVQHGSPAPIALSWP